MKSYKSLQTTIIATLQQNVSKVSLYNLGYICTLLESQFYSESNGIIFNFVGQRYGRIIKYV